MPWSAIIGAGANLLGGALNRSSANDANESAAAQAAENRQMQYEFATTGLQWRANDAMKAYKATGIHPLAMLGVQGATYTPSSVNFTPSGMGDSIARAGQDVSRAIAAGSSRADRAKLLAAQEVQLNNASERGMLENELLKVRIASERMRLAQGVGPGVPDGSERPVIPGQNSPFERRSVPGVGHLRMPGGELMPVKSDEASKRLEDDLIGNVKHFVARYLGAQFNAPAHAPGHTRLKPGFKWYVDWKGDYDQVPIAPADLWKRGRHGSQRN